MFAQGLIYIFILLGFAWLAWELIIKPILKSKGIEIEEDETDYTKKLERLKHEFSLMEKSTQAAKEGLEILKDIKYMEDKIKEIEKREKEI